MDIVVGDQRLGVNKDWTAPFVGVPTFLATELVIDTGGRSFEIGVFGAPTDEGSPFMPGSRFGPRGIREHSMRFGAGGIYDPVTKRTYLERERAEVSDAPPRLGFGMEWTILRMSPTSS